MPWHASLDIDYQLQDAQRTVAIHRHDGPLRVFHSLYPEGPGICHNVVVHPPGGLVEGDTLDISVSVASGAHGLISTPGATRFYRSLDGAPATQRVRIALAPGARFEWVPLETIAYPGCNGHNTLDVALAEGAEWLAWDVTALGLPGSAQPFDHGMLRQRLCIEGHWLEQGRLDARDAVLMDGPLGLAGHRCMGTLVFASGSALARSRKTQLLEVIQTILPPDGGECPAGVTCPNDHVVVVRVLGPVVEPVMALVQRAWALWRQTAWGLTGQPPRIWRV